MSINTQAFNVLNTFANTINEGVKQLRTGLIALGIVSVEDAQPIVMQWAAQRYSVALVESKSNRNKGQMVLDRDSASFAAADKAYKRVIEALRGDVAQSLKAEGAAEAEEIEIPAEIAAAAAKLAALCAEYQGAKRLAAKAVAAAFAK